MPVSPELVETNFVQVDVDDLNLTSAQAIERLARAGVGLSGTVRPGVLRAVTHLDITDDDIDARDRGRARRARHRRPCVGLVLRAVLFDWGETLSHFEWDDELLAAGHAAGLEAIGRGEEADAFTARFAAELLPALLAEGAAAAVDYEAELRDALGGASDEELDRFLDAEHAAWRPARALVEAAHALLETLRGRGLRLAIVANTWPEPARLVRRELDELGITERVDRIVLSGEAGVRKPARAIFELALAQFALDPLEVLFVGDRLVDDVGGAAAVGMSTAQALWFRADEGGDVEPDFLAFTPADVLTAVKRLGG